MWPADTQTHKEKIEYKGWSTGCSSRGPEFNSQHPHGGSQPSIISVPDLTPLLGTRYTGGVQRSGALFWHAGMYAGRILYT